MKEKTKEKLLLCLQEVSWIKELLAEKQTDSITARMLCIYASIRLDDVYHCMPDYPDHHPNKAYTDPIKEEYKKRWQDARNKLGGHFQSIEVSEETENRNLGDIVERNLIFQTITFDKLKEMLDDATIFYQIATHTEDVEPDIVSLSVIDKQTLIDVCQFLNNSDRVLLSTSALHLSQKNAVGVFFCSPAQQKVQKLLTIETFVDLAHTLYNKVYTDTNIQLMFKRMLICWIMNYHDNLFNPASSDNAQQYDKGLDELLYEMFKAEKDDATRNQIKKYFDKLKSLPIYSATIVAAKDIRNTACAHLDSTLNLSDINTRLSGFDVSKLYRLYDCMYKTLRNVLDSHFLLQHLAIKGQTFYDMWVEDKGVLNFYNDETNQVSSNYFTNTITLEEAIRVIKEHEMESFDLAMEKVRNTLFKAKGRQYQLLKKLILSRFRADDLSYDELTTYADIFYSIRHGYPEKNCLFFIQLWSILQRKDKRSHRFILYSIAGSAVYDVKGETKKLIEELAISKYEPHVLYGAVINAKACINSQTSIYAYQQNPIVDARIIDYCKNVGNLQLRLATEIALSSRWYCGNDIHFGNWVKYNQFFDSQLLTVLASYMAWASLDVKSAELLNTLVREHKYSELLWYILRIENQKTGTSGFFASLIEDCIYSGNRSYDSETAYWALCMEELGHIEIAYNWLKKLHEDNLDKGLTMTFCRFLHRHAEYKDELSRLKASLLDFYSFTQDEIDWMEQDKQE